MPQQTFFNLPEEKRQRILDVAIDEFAAHDYRNASVSRIVKRAGIAKGSFYQYFENKRDLFYYLLDRVTEAKLAFLGQRQPPDPEMALFPYLRWMFRVGVGFELAHPRLSRIAYRAWYGDVPFRDEMEAHVQGRATDIYRQWVARGIAQGDIDPQVDPALATWVLGAVFNGLGDFVVEHLSLDRQQIAREGVPPEVKAAMQEIFDGLLYILEHGLGQQEP